MKIAHVGKPYLSRAAMRHYKLLTYMLLVGSIGFSIICCGRDGTNKSSEQPIVLGAESASQFSSAGLGVDGTKVAEIEQRVREQELAASTVQAQVERIPVVIPTNPPKLSSRSVRIGLTEDCRDVFSDQLLATNCWTGTVDGETISVFAGSLQHDPMQGVLIIYTTSLDGTSSSNPKYYQTVHKDGAITINKVVYSQVQISTKKEKDLVFDLITYEWR